MDRVYFRQEVLVKYQAAAGFTIEDDGSVSCYNDWGLVRSTHRIGNELISTAIGDFAEGVPFEEWLHWKQYSVDPPSQESYNILAAELTIAAAVNRLYKALTGLNTAFEQLISALEFQSGDVLWSGTIDSLAASQMKCVYPLAAPDDEFLKRATFTSTFILEGLNTRLLRTVLCSIDRQLEMSKNSPPTPLGSRALLQRLTLLAAILEQCRPDRGAITSLVMSAEGKQPLADVELKAELEKIHQSVREKTAPLAFLYELRNCGGVAHSIDKKAAGVAAGKFGLPAHGWKRHDYLKLLSLLTDSLSDICQRFEEAASAHWSILVKRK